MHIPSVKTRFFRDHRDHCRVAGSRAAEELHQGAARAEKISGSVALWCHHGLTILNYLDSIDRFV